MSRKKIATAITRAGLVGVALIGFGGAALAGQGSVTIGYENNGADPYMVTQGLHLFQKNMPVHVHLKYFSSGPAAMSALASNSLQFMCGLGVTPFVEAIAHGLPLTIVYNQERYMTGAGIVVRPGHGIHSVADLKGKKLAIVVGSQSTFELATFLAAAHVPYGSVHQVNMSPDDMRIAWRTKGINAAMVWNPVFHSLQTMGGHVLKTDKELPRTATSYNVCIANRHWVKKHPKMGTDFVKALNAGVSYTEKHRQKALKIMADQSGVKPSVAKVELGGYEIFTGKQQASSKVLGNHGASKSATEQTVVNTAKTLLKIGRIDKLPKDMPAAVDAKFATMAVK